MVAVLALGICRLTFRDLCLEAVEQNGRVLPEICMNGD